MRLSQTPTHYLLYIHPSQKERAKAINGRKWDPERVCWTYPKTPSTYDAIIAEFGTELVENTATPPAPPSSSLSAPDLQAELTQLKTTLASMVSATQTDTQLKNLLAQKELEATQIREELALAKQTIKRLEAEQTHLQAQLQNSYPRNWQDVIREIAINATDSDPAFVHTISQLQIDNGLPIQLAINLEQQIRRMMRITDENISLAELLSQAREAELIDKQTADLCHQIRKQRNIMAHESVHPKTIPARVIFCLLAAALVWTNLPEA